VLPAAGTTPAASADGLLNPTRVYMYPRQADTWLEAQIALARRGISCGPIDGVGGAQTGTALRAFQQSEELPETGQLDNATRARLILATPPFEQITLSAEDLAGLQPLAKTWLGKSRQTALAYETALELTAERTHAHAALLRRLNPSVDWAAVTPGTKLTVPAVERPAPRGKAAHIHIYMGERTLQVRDETGVLLAHFPVSIARLAEKRPEGELHVTVVIPNPVYTFDPAVFTESAEARTLGRKLIIPAGPNNPVGLAWIGLDRPGYGIHGTPTPEHVGRTESHGCFRLANWDALALLEFAWVGLPVIVDP
jgi:lipoprotein-anchoring transpeptidase ErfK/SrfK